jgi:DNA repair photolyase
MMGPLRFQEKELKVDYTQDKYEGKTIFVEHTHDLFHPDIPTQTIYDVLIKCSASAFVNGINFVFQTRNTLRAYTMLSNYDLFSPKFTFTFGTTIETNREVGNAPLAWKRVRGLLELKALGYRTFVTVEPILEFDLECLANLIACAKPDFVNIGADSKGTGLEEPSAKKVLALIDLIQGIGIEIRTKRNLDRLIGKSVAL